MNGSAHKSNPAKASLSPQTTTLADIIMQVTHVAGDAIALSKSLQ